MRSGANFLDVVSKFYERSLRQSKSASNKVKTRAEKNWDIVRSHIQRGLLQSIMNQTNASKNDFLSLIDDLWTHIQRHCPDATSKDSTTQFVVAGWAAIKAAQLEVSRLKSPLKTPLAKTPKTGDSLDKEKSSETHKSSLVNSLELEESHNQSNFDPSLKSVANESSKKSGLERRGGLSLDAVPNLNFGKVFGEIAKGLTTQAIDEVDFYTLQVHFNRGWKILLLALTQAEPFARYMAMAALQKTIPVINETLLDSTIHKSLFHVLVNLMVSDERTENRLKAVYLIGKLGLYLGSVREHANLIEWAFRELARKLLEIKNEERQSLITAPEPFTPQNRSLKIYLFHSLGKFVKINNKMFENLLLYLIYDEFLSGDTKFKVLPKGKKSKTKDSQMNEASF
ncbi:hypothetical protein HK096_005153, partial [Nowakowskiella sp. JEL0078]